MLDDGSVFAMRDAFPVSPGHTLVIPRRHVATWFHATLKEQHAITAAIAKVKARLDAEIDPPPDGYNVGWNAGEAAGQTVMHLHVHLHVHVHVIPRWHGDHPSPRGGVRAVIPGKADYTASPAATNATADLRPGVADLTTGPKRPLLPWLRSDLASATQVDIAVAFVWPRGVERIFAHLADCLDRGGRLRLLTGDYGDATDPAALRHLLDLQQIGEGRATLRIFQTAVAGTSFHPKAYLLSAGSGAPPVAYVGSSNLSVPALEEGVEWNVRLHDRTAVARAQAAFDALLSHPATCEIDDAWIDAYARRRRITPATARQLAPPDVEPEPTAPPPEPHEIQREALAALAATRTEGNRAGLVVLATGLGRTWLSAFDSVGFSRVLFVAHREERWSTPRGTCFMFPRTRPSSTDTGQRSFAFEAVPGLQRKLERMR